MAYISRTLENLLKNPAFQFPVTLVTGPRQVGKTTLLRHAAGEERAYVTLDDPLLATLAREEPSLFLQRFPSPVLIDEIQYAPQLLPYIKMEVDRDRTPGRFWLTGSQQFHLMRGVSESLAGRVGVLRLLGFSYRELENDANRDPFWPTPDHLQARQTAVTGVSPTLPELYEHIWRGSFPALWGDAAPDRDLFYSSYVQTYLQRDIRDLAQVGDATTFLRFLRACAARTAQLLNLQDLCRDADIAPATGKRWLSILEGSGVVFLLEPFHTNVTSRLVKTPKLYLLDTGLAAWLTAWSSPATLEAGSSCGAFLETWAVTEVIKSWWHHGKSAPVFFYRDKDKKEIDLLIQRDGALHPVEVKKTAAPDRDSFRHFQALGRLGFPVGPGCVLCLVPRPLPLSDTVWAFPLGLL